MKNSKRTSLSPLLATWSLRRAPRLCVPFVCAATMLAGLPAHAAQTGELAGVVVDEGGEPIANALVVLTSPQMIGGSRELRTDDDGSFRFPNLDPGGYTVTLSKPDKVGFVEQDIYVGIDKHVEREYVLEAAVATDAKDKVIKVTATRPMVDTTRSTQGSSFTPDLTDRLNTGRSYQSVALLTPGVTDGSVASGNPSIHGGTAVSNVYLLDGLNITDPVTQTFSTNFNFDAIGELQVLTGALDAEYGSTTGGVLNIVTKSGGDEFEFDGSVYWSPNQLQLLDPSEIGKNDSNQVTANLSVGGPIIREKLWFYLSGQYVDGVVTTPVLNSEYGSGYVHPADRFNAFYGLGKLKFQAAPWQKFTLLMQGDPTWIVNERQRDEQQVHAAAERQRFQGGAQILGTSETTLSPSLFWKTQVGYGGSRLFIFPMNCSSDFDDCAANGTPGHTNQFNGTSTINDTKLSDDRRYRITGASSLSYFLSGFFGDHEIKGGLEGAATWSTTREFAPGGQVFTDNGLNSADTTGAGNPFQLTIYDKPLNKTVTSNVVSAYVQDTWRPIKTLTIRPGVRFDSSRGYNDVADGGVEIFSFNNISPRVGAAWDPIGDSKTVIRGGYHFYNETGLLTVPSFVGRSLSSKTFNYNELTGKYDKLDRVEGGANAVVFKPGLRAPNMHEVTLGVQREIFDNAAVSVDFTWRHRQNMFEDDESNVIWNRNGSDAVGFRNNQQRFIFSVDTPDEAVGQYMGVDVMFEKRFADNWQALVTYTLSKLEGTADEYVTYTFDNPTQREFEYGFLQDDQRHKLAVSLSYDLPFGFQVGGTGTYQSGRPLSKLFLNSFYSDYLDKRAPAGYDPVDVDNPEDNIEIRTPDVFRMNARVAWRLKDLTTQDIWLIADVSNVFNMRTPQGIGAYEQRDLPTFGKQLSRASPLSAELAVRYMF
jgi:hypothetical protein